MLLSLTTLVLEDQEELVAAAVLGLLVLSPASLVRRSREPALSDEDTVGFVYLPNKVVRDEIAG